MIIYLCFFSNNITSHSAMKIIALQAYTISLSKAVNRTIYGEKWLFRVLPESNCGQKIRVLSKERLYQLFYKALTD